ncbi:amino acid adenylation domain-containing protein [Nostoc sp. C117]|uniref:amino acid adenylation domain-containing protein n=1 Tax=Nostoc sp. C117 TaxID=3349875 RepID=UPI00370DB698
MYQIITKTLLDILTSRGEYQADRQAYLFLQNGETESGSLTYGELDKQARAIAVHLQSMQGERALLLYPSGLEFITAFFGCLYAGVVAVPVYPPRRNHKLSRLLSIVNDAEAKIALTTTSILTDIEKGWEEEPELAQLKLLATDIIEANPQKFVPKSVTLESLAFLQYTSGSTGTPKGVMVTHGNLLHNQQMIQAVSKHTEESTYVSWLPLYHDLGLGNAIQALFIGAKCILMPPVAFLQRPVRWLQAISQYQAHTSGGPNFAYELCVDKVSLEERETLNLSSWKVAFNGAEPIQAETLELFQKTFSNCGFELEAFSPCYGLAESTAAVTGSPKGAKPVFCRVSKTALEQNLIVAKAPEAPDTRILVSSGKTWLDQKVVIVEPCSYTACSDNQVGEIWVSGSSVVQGYWGKPEQTKETFQAYLADTGSGPFLRTGDLGFIRNEELFVTGRLKDVIIIRGRNHYPQDIELTVENSHPSLRKNCSAAFSVEMEKEECLVVVCEIERTQLRNLNTLEIVKEIQIAVATKHELEVCHVMLLKTGSIPKTSSGKIQRRVCKVEFLKDSLSVVGQWHKSIENHPKEYAAPSTATQEIISNIFISVLNVERVSIHDNIFTLGGHSLLATQVISRLRQTFGIEIPLRAVFESPTITQLEQTITQLRTTNNGLTLPPIQPREPDREQLPLSYAQERLWFLDQLSGPSATYNIPTVVRINGDLDINALQQALSEIVRRHEVLRTSFQTVNGTPIQVIHPSATININLVDLQQVADTECETLLRQQVQLEAITPFDLKIAPLIRCNFLQLSPREYVLLMTTHHIVSDGWSMGVFIAELSALYQAFCAGVPSSLSELPIQYADFTVWQRQCLSGYYLETQLNYWLSQLHGVPELLQLPTDRTRPSVQTYQGATQSFTLNTDITQKLQTLSRESGTTLFMTLHAAFATFLYRYSGQSDILIGLPIANRNRSEIEPLIGFFVNTLVLRTTFEENLSFETLLLQVRETTLQAYEHQDVPFEQVVEKLQPQRSLSYSPLFQVMFIWQNAPMGEVEIPGCTCCQLDTKSTIAKFDLTLSMSETDQQLVGSWEYNTDLFDGSTIARMAAHFQNLLSAIVENPQQAVNELPLLSAAERHQLLVEWNDTECEYPLNKCIHQLFEEQVDKTPQTIAVVFENQQLSYQQLNQRANQLAHHLQSLGVRPEMLVGICVERSVEMVVGLLGILKAGGAYVPLDPTYPQERLSYILADSGVEVLLTQQQLVQSLPQHEAVVVCLDTEWDQIAQHCDKNPITDVISNNLAYTIYTSGSTGKPKGVQILHSAVVNFLCTMRQQPGITADDILVGVTTFNFDIAALEIFLPIIVGACLVVAKREVTLDGQRLLELLVNFGVTIMQATPVTWRLLLETGWQNSHQLKILCGGEVLPWELANELQVRSTSLWNLYGPTETTIWSLISQVESQSGLISIGRPIANTQIYILDSHLQPVPIGVPGELHIGGVGLARGYLNQPKLTQEKFIPNPFYDGKSERLYKTGDLARYNSDSNIEYIGRIDNQIKIRGFRIELGEIETVLNTHPQIQQAVVIVREDIPDDKRLIAYVVTSDETPITKQLREFLKNKLPEYMLPSVFVTLDTLPFTPNGKIDRKALPTPDREISRKHEYIPPSTVIEIQLTQILSSILNITPVGVRDNFFELGGNSLLIVKFLSKLQQICGVDLPVYCLFEFPTVADIAPVVEKIRQVGTSNNITDNILDLSAEAVLDSEIQPQSLAFDDVSEPKCIFLTGATGFVGTYLLYELLQRTNADIYCLVRAANPDEGKKRLQTQLEAYLLWEEDFSCRIISVLGDLSQPYLGVTAAEFENLAKCIDVIYHNGALVNFIYPYSTLKAANVTGTEEVLRLASQIKVKPVHFISTLSVFDLSKSSQLQVISESDPLNDSQGLIGGYAQSKWVAEKLIMIARERGLPVCIYRLGHVAGHSKTGIGNTSDWLSIMIKGCIQLRMFPELERMIEMIPVDYVSKAIIAISQAKSSLGKAFHITNPDQISGKYLSNWIEKFGYPVKQISFVKWRKELIHHINYFPDNALHSLLPMFPAESDFKKLEIKFDYQNTVKALSGTGISCPQINAELLDIYFSYFLSIGFLNTPEQT